MSELLHGLIRHSAQRTPDALAIKYKAHTQTYSQLDVSVNQMAGALVAADVLSNDRVAVFLPKQMETVIALFGISRAGGVFIPINPLLKSEQVQYILQDCNVRLLVTSRDRATALMAHFDVLPDLHTVVVIDAAKDGARQEPLEHPHVRIIPWQIFMQPSRLVESDRPRIDSDMAAILYTSGSTGKPKGVVLSHRNMVTGARSVVSYLNNTAADRLLAVLPLSFDYGLSQLTSAFLVGASVVLLDYLFPKDIVNLVVQEKITGLAAVPSLWVQVADLVWPDEAKRSLRYITNSGGAMPRNVLSALREKLPNTAVYLMYGLTEAFRSSFLPPNEIDSRPDSIGKAIPNVELMVVREDGTHCSPNEPGELVHRGSLVAMGYWNDAQRTAERFRPAPGQIAGLTVPEIAVWSGDTVRMDEEGFLYFIGRKDDMIKSSGYRISPTEIEEVIYASGLVKEAVALGLPHPTLGQAIVVVAILAPGKEADVTPLIDYCKQHLPTFMVPTSVQLRLALPRNANDKIDRKRLVSELNGLFQEL